MSFRNTNRDVAIRPNTSGKRFHSAIPPEYGYEDEVGVITAPVQEGKGIPKTQKDRIGQYMEEFRTKNGGCILEEGAPISEYSAFPEIGEVNRIYLYGLCKESARKSDSDENAEAKLYELASGTEVTPDKARVVVITLEGDTETRKYY